MRSGASGHVRVRISVPGQIVWPPPDDSLARRILGVLHLVDLLRVSARRAAGLFLAAARCIANRRPKDWVAVCRKPRCSARGLRVRYAKRTKVSELTARDEEPGDRGRPA